MLPACERAVTLAPERYVSAYRDSRGLAGALTGDVRGAIDDFRFLVESADAHAVGEDLIGKRRAWIAALEAGDNPFDAATLEALRAE